MLGLTRSVDNEAARRRLRGMRGSYLSAFKIISLHHCRLIARKVIVKLSRFRNEASTNKHAELLNSSKDDDEGSGIRRRKR